MPLIVMIMILTDVTADNFMFERQRKSKQLTMNIKNFYIFKIWKLRTKSVINNNLCDIYMRQKEKPKKTKLN